MKKILLAIMLLAVVPAAIFAQTQDEMEELRRQVLYYKKCFPKRSVLETTPVEYTLGDGTVVSAKIRSDFSSVNFVQADPGLRSVNFVLGDGGDDYINRNIEDIFDDYAGCSPAFHIVGHGIADPDGSMQTVRIGGRDLTADQVAEMIIRQLGGYHHVLNAEGQPFPVVIHSCNAAKGDNSFAEQLSRRLSQEILDLKVVAPDGVVYSERSTERDMNTGLSRTVYTEKVAGKSGFTSGSDAGRWNVFTNGRRSQGTPDYKTTVKSIR